MKNLIKKSTTILLSVVSFLIFATAIASVSDSPWPKLISINMSHMAFLLSTFYILINFALYKAHIKGFVHIITYPVSSFLSAVILFTYSFINHKKDGGVYLAEEMSLVSISVASISGSLIVLGLTYTLIKHKTNKPLSN